MKKLVALFVALACAVCLAGLVACGGGPSDEELIKADAEKVIGTEITGTEMAEGLKNDSSMQSLAEMGLDIDAYAEAIAGKFSFAVDSVDVEGDKGVAHCTITTPSFGDDAEAIINEITDNMNVEGKSYDELMKEYFDTLLEKLASDDWPIASSAYDIDYTKEGGEWKMVNAATIESDLSSMMSSVAGL